MQTGLKHIHKRKRVSLTGYEPYPSRKSFRRFLDKFAYVIGALGIILTIPQILKIWVGQDATGVSVIAWIGYMITSSFWLTYAIVHKEKPLIITYSLWILVKLPIVIGTIIYG